MKNHRWSIKQQKAIIKLRDLLLSGYSGNLRNNWLCLYSSTNHGIDCRLCCYNRSGNAPRSKNYPCNSKFIHSIPINILEYSVSTIELQYGISEKKVLHIRRIYGRQLNRISKLWNKPFNKVAYDEKEKT